MDQRIEAELKLITQLILGTVPVHRIYLFGSYAGGTPHADSDLDIYVVMPDDVDIREIDAMRAIRKGIRDKTSMPVDVLVNKESTFSQRAANPTMERKIAREGILLYGQGS